MLRILAEPVSRILSAHLKGDHVAPLGALGSAGPGMAFQQTLCMHAFQLPPFEDSMDGNLLTLLVLLTGIVTPAQQLPLMPESTQNGNLLWRRGF